jgi:hypothetical protein
VNESKEAQFANNTTYVNVDGYAEVLAEGYLVDFHQIKMHVFALLFGERVVLLCPLHTPDSIENGQTLGFRT